MKMPFMKMLKSSGPNDFIVFYLLLFSVTSLKLRCLDGAFWTVLEDMSRSHVGACTQTNFQCFFPY